MHVSKAPETPSELPFAETVKIININNLIGGGEGRIRTHGADNRTTAFEFYNSHADLSHPVPKRVVWFAIPKPMILVCDAQCHAVPCSWFAIWFANFLEVRQLGRGS